MSVLEKIVSQRRGDLPELYDQLGQTLPGATCASEVYELTASDYPKVAPAPSLRAALLAQSRCSHPALILECKAASPSQGKLAQDYRPQQLATAYAKVATGISVLTEGRNFGGSFADLAKVRAVTDLPILAKDFVIDPVQIALAYLSGASAVLLMLSVLDDETYLSLRRYAQSLGLEALTEVACEAEAKRASRLGANLVDINHRDLHTLEIDMNRVRELAPLVGKQAVIVAASGMSELAEITARRDVAHGFLVGSALSGSNDLPAALTKLSGRDITKVSEAGSSASSPADEPRNRVDASDSVPLVKVCGLTDVEAAQALSETAIEYAGINLAPGSPRKLEVAEAAEIMKTCPNLKYVAVTRAGNRSEMVALKENMRQIEATGDVKFAAVQLHFYPEDNLKEALLVGTAKTVFPDVEMWRALPAQVDSEILNQTLADEEVSVVILDSPKPGSGTRWSWSDLPAATRSQLVVAGGVGVENARQILELGYRGLDANSALEETGSGRPRKKPELIREFAAEIA